MCIEHNAPSNGGGTVFVLIRALARAHRWKRLLEEGRYASTTEIAEVEKIGRSFVNRLLNLTLLAPDIQEAILEGRQPKGIVLEEMVRAITSEWAKQQRALSFATDASVRNRRLGHRYRARPFRE